MVPNIKLCFTLLLINLGLLLACGGKQSRKDSDAFIPSDAGSTSGIAKENSSDAAKDQAEDPGEEEIQASRPAVISGSHLACVPDSNNPMSALCTISAEGIKQVQIENKSLFILLGSELQEVESCESQEDGSCLFSLESSSQTDFEDAEVHVFNSKEEMINHIANL